jgi:hypothetical protein
LGFVHPVVGKASVLICSDVGREKCSVAKGHEINQFGELELEVCVGRNLSTSELAVYRKCPELTLDHHHNSLIGALPIET